MAIVKRAEPPALTTSVRARQGTQSTLISAPQRLRLDAVPNLEPGAVKKVRLIEGFSAEEGFPDMFGLTEFDGQSLLGEIDPSARRLVQGARAGQRPGAHPADRQVRHGGRAPGPGGATASEPVWIQGRAGEARVCGGCHEDRTKTHPARPGLLGAAGARAPRSSTTGPDPPAARLDATSRRTRSRAFPGTRRSSRSSTAPAPPATTARRRGQPELHRHRHDRHDDLHATPSTCPRKAETIDAGDMMYTYTASYISLLGPQMAFREKQVMVTGDLQVYVEPGNAAASDVDQDASTRRRAIPGGPERPRLPRHAHPPGRGRQLQRPRRRRSEFQLTPDEYYLLILNIDIGGQYYFRENKPAAGSY